MLDPACGSGAFLFAALNILEPLYSACLERMETFIDEYERAGPNGDSRKYGDFRRTLAEVEKHPNREYFILKSIVINNLYGVDIMDEAVEICKLRLFLKLVAQVGDVARLEPLPDIDFNIRAGNTLVGFTSLDDVRRAMAADSRGNIRLLLPEDEAAIREIEEQAEIIDRAFERFRAMQADFEMDQEKFREAKRSLRDRLDRLRDRLDKYLAVEYLSNPDNPVDFDKWLTSHKPFHWFAEYYGVYSGGGFDITLGNPPYVRISSVDTYTVRNFRTIDCGDLYAPIVERSLNILSDDGRSGFIVPLSAFSLTSFEPLQDVYCSLTSSIWISNWSGDAHPSRLFEGANNRLQILLATRGSHGEASRIATSKYIKWYAVERENLFRTQPLYLAAPKSQELMSLEASIPKLHSPVEVAIVRKLQLIDESVSDLLAPAGDSIIYYTRKVSFFLQFLDFIPIIRDSKGRTREPSELKTLSFSDDFTRDLCLLCLSSSLFYWFYTVNADCRNLNKREVISFPIPIEEAYRGASDYAEKVRQLMCDYVQNSTFRTVNYRRVGDVTVQYFNFRASKTILDEIDREIGTYYGLTDTEIDFITNFEVKYRMGGAA